MPQTVRKRPILSLKIRPDIDASSKPISARTTAAPSSSTPKQAPPPNASQKRRNALPAFVALGKALEAKGCPLPPLLVSAVHHAAPLPMKVGIKQDVLAVTPEEFHKDMTALIANIARSTRYLNNMAKQNSVRYDITCNQVGPVDPDDRAFAVYQLKQRQKL